MKKIAKGIAAVYLLTGVALFLFLFWRSEIAHGGLFFGVGRCSSAPS